MIIVSKTVRANNFLNFSKVIRLLLHTVPGTASLTVIPESLLPENSIVKLEASLSLRISILWRDLNNLSCNDWIETGLDYQSCFRSRLLLLG